jgi:hypothetical protein
MRHMITGFAAGLLLATVATGGILTITSHATGDRWAA